MKATVDKVLPVRGGAQVLLTVTFAAPLPRTHTYRVEAQAYAEAGSPTEGDALHEEAQALLTAEEDMRLAYGRAVKILAAGDNTRTALCRKLRERGFPAAAVEAAVARLIGEGYIKEDELLLRQLGIYAARRWGPKKFMPALLAKGFTRADVMTALARAREEGVYDVEAIKSSLLAEVADEDAAARRAYLYRYGF